MGTEKRQRQKANRALKHQQEVQAAARRKLYRKIAIGVAGVAAVVLFVWIASTIVGDDDPAPTPVTVPDTLPTVETTTEPTVDTTTEPTTESTGG